jgi:hypothetical protein
MNSVEGRENVLLLQYCKEERATTFKLTNPPPHYSMHHMYCTLSNNKISTKYSLQYCANKRTKQHWYNTLSFKILAFPSAYTLPLM